MPSGALTLLEASKSGSDLLSKGTVQTIFQGSPFIQSLPWIPFQGNAYGKRYEDTLPNVGFRQVNGTYTSTHGTDHWEYWGVAILGGEIKVDPFLVHVTGSEEDVKTKQFVKAAKANSMRFDYEFIHGDGTGNGFKGIKQHVTEGKGQEYEHSNAGATLTFASLDAAIDLRRSGGSFDVILTNKTVRRQLTNLARSEVQALSLIDFEDNTMGKKVMSYDGIPFQITEDGINSSGTVSTLLPFTEDPGDGASDTCSVYLLKYGEDEVAGLLGAGGSMTVRDFGEMESQPQILGRIEWYPGVAVFDPNSAVRISGILAA